MSQIYLKFLQLFEKAAIPSSNFGGQSVAHCCQLCHEANSAHFDNLH